MADEDPGSTTKEPMKSVPASVTWRDVDVDTSSLEGGGPSVRFTWQELDELFAACKIVDEDSVTFVRRAALERIEQVLKRERSDVTAAD